MQIELFDSMSTMSNGVVVFPARIAIPERNTCNTFKYQKSFRHNDYDLEVISAVFDKPSNRVKLIADLSPKQVINPAKGELVKPEQRATIRSTFEAKLDIPRGAISTQKVTTYEIVEAPDYWNCSGGKLKDANGTITDVQTDQLRRNICQQLYSWLKDYYERNGCPEEVDRRRLPDMIKTYTGELREAWRVREHNFTYPANSLATLIGDSLTGRRITKLTLDQLLEWHLIPHYPTITKAAARAAVWDSMRTTAFVGVYVVGSKGRFTKNAQLCHKLTTALGTSITLQELEQSVKQFMTSLSGKPAAQQPQISLSQPNEGMLFLGTTRTTRREES